MKKLVLSCQIFEVKTAVEVNERAIVRSTGI